MKSVLAASEKSLLVPLRYVMVHKGLLGTHWGEAAKRSYEIAACLSKSHSVRFRRLSDSYRNVALSATF